MNKGKKLIFCSVCKRKRYCSSRILLPARNWKKWTCSKKHEWDVKIGPLEEIIAIEIDRITPKLKTLFERDDIFYTRLRNK